MGATEEDQIVALRDRGLADNGDGCEGVYWGYLMPFLGSALLPNADLPKCNIKVRVACTNKAVLSPARSLEPIHTFCGRASDRRQLAHRLDKDPADVRRLNLNSALPYTTATGVNYDSGDFLVWDHLIKTIDLKKFRAEQREAWPRGRYIGVGFGVGAELSGVASSVLVPMENQPGYGAATVRLDPRGKVQVFEGDAPGGQGHETASHSRRSGIRHSPKRRHGDTWRYQHHALWVRDNRRPRKFPYTISAISTACRVYRRSAAGAGARS